MKNNKEIFVLRSIPYDPNLVKQTEPGEPLILFSLKIGENILFLPELHFMIQSFYFEN